jgi:hypothetical protein
LVCGSQWDDDAVQWLEQCGGVLRRGDRVGSAVGDDDGGAYFAVRCDGPGTDRGAKFWMAVLTDLRKPRDHGHR